MVKDIKEAYRIALSDKINDGRNAKNDNIYGYEQESCYVFGMYLHDGNDSVYIVDKKTGKGQKKSGFNIPELKEKTYREYSPNILNKFEKDF